MLFRSLKCTDCHDSNILCSRFESSGPPTRVTGPKLFIPGTQLTPFDLFLGLSVLEKNVIKKQKIWFVNEFELIHFQDTANA